MKKKTKNIVLFEAMNVLTSLTMMINVTMYNTYAFEFTINLYNFNCQSCLSKAGGKGVRGRIKELPNAANKKREAQGYRDLVVYCVPEITWKAIIITQQSHD